MNEEEIEEEDEWLFGVEEEVKRMSGDNVKAIVIDGTRVREIKKKLLVIGSSFLDYHPDEMYEEDTNKFQFVEHKGQDLIRTCQAAPLPDGTIFVLHTTHSNMEYIYDPILSTVTSITPSLCTIANAPIIVTLKTGDVFICGGMIRWRDFTDVCLIYNVKNKTCVPCRNKMTRPRGHPALCLLRNGHVLICGGLPTTSRDTEIFDPDSESFRKGPDMLMSRYGCTCTRMHDGRVLLCGGSGDARSTEIYDPQSNAFSLGPKLIRARKYHSEALLSDGRVLLIGGEGRDVSKTTEIYDPFSNSFREGPTLCTGREFVAAVPF
jgi:hypothetical protein